MPFLLFQLCHFLFQSIISIDVLCVYSIFLQRSKTVMFTNYNNTATEADFKIQSFTLYILGSITNMYFVPTDLSLFRADVTGFACVNFVCVCAQVCSYKLQGIFRPHQGRILALSSRLSQTFLIALFYPSIPLSFSRIVHFSSVYLYI